MGLVSVTKRPFLLENHININDLLKSDSVELSLKDVDFFHIVIFAPDKVALPGQGQLCVFGPLGRLVLLRVVEHQERNPESLNILQGEGVL